MPKPDIYKQHDRAFANVSAYVVVRHGERVATVAFKFPKDGAGRLYCYVHWLGRPMVRGMAGGYGYDKSTAAAGDAGRKMPAELPADYYADGTPVHPIAEQALYVTFVDAIRKDGGTHWDNRLREAGFEVWQAV